MYYNDKNYIYTPQGRGKGRFDLKIAMVGHKRVPSRDGGIEVAVEELSSRMAAQGHDVTLYNRGGKAPREKYRGVKIRRVPVIRIPGISAVMGAFLATVRAVFGGYDCIHLHAEGTAAMAFLPKLFKIRTVVTIHGLDWKRSKWGRFASWYLKKGEKAAVKRADEIVVLSNAMKRYFLDTYGRETVYIPNGMEKASRKEAALIRKKWALEKDGYILYLGRLVPEKGIGYLIDAYKALDTDKKLVIVGSPDEMPDYFHQLRQTARGDDRVIFAGFADGDLLAELFSNCYVYCLPSELEGMPLSLLEAMSYGCCCVCSDIPECVEVVGDHGFHFPVGDVAALGQLLGRLCRDPELVEERRRRVREEFVHNTWDEVTERTLALYGGVKA